MKKIKVGEYVRFHKGAIFKCTEWEVDYCNDFLKENFHLYIDNKKEKKVKHSFNIIDLIEVGDYVNGKLIHYVLENPKNGETIICYGNGKHIDNKHIKSVVTKEVFASAEYRVETD